MSHITAVREVLTSSSAVTALLGARLYPEELPQNVALPAAVLTLVSDVGRDAFDTQASSVLRNARVQIDIYDRDFDGAEAAANAVDDALQAKKSASFSALQADRRHFLEKETKLYRVSMDFSVWRGR